MGWDVVDRKGHPIPDDPGVIGAQVDHLRAVARTIQTQVDRMTNCDAGLVWESDAADGFRKVVKKLPTDLNALRTRYNQVANALGEFNTVVRNTRAQAEDGLAKAEAASNELAQAQAGVNQMKSFNQQAQQMANQANQGAPPGTTPIQPQAWTGPNYDAQLTNAQEALQRAKNQVDEAVKQFRAAAKSAAHAVGSAIDDPLKDDTSLWGKVKRTVKKGANWAAENLPLEAIAKWAGTIAAVLGVLSLIPFLSFLAIPALVLGGVALLADAALMINKGAKGEELTAGDWATLAIDVVSVATGVGALRLAGTARAARGAAEVSEAGARTATAARGAAAVTKAEKAGKVEQLTSGWKRFPNRLLGRTGRAERQLAEAQRGLNAAAAREAQAVEAARASRSAANAADARARPVARVNAFVEKVGWANTAKAWIPDQSLLSRAPDIGNQIPARPIR